MQPGILKKVDDLGRVTIPKEYRDFYHLDAKELVSVVAVQDGLLISNPKYKVVEIHPNENR